MHLRLRCHRQPEPEEGPLLLGKGLDEIPRPDSSAHVSRHSPPLPDRLTGPSKDNHTLPAIVLGDPGSQRWSVRVLSPLC